MLNKIMLSFIFVDTLCIFVFESFSVFFQSCESNLEFGLNNFVLQCSMLYIAWKFVWYCGWVLLRGVVSQTPALI